MPNGIGLITGMIAAGRAVAPKNFRLR